MAARPTSFGGPQVLYSIDARLGGGGIGDVAHHAAAGLHPAAMLALLLAARRRAIERFDVRSQVERLQAVYARAGRPR